MSFERRRRYRVSAQGCFNPGEGKKKKFATLKALANALFANTFGVAFETTSSTQGCCNPGLKVANASGVWELH
jgi:hypothetical protein